MECKLMKIETAKKVFKDRAENFYGMTVAWLADEMEATFQKVGYYNENEKTVKAYKVLQKAEIV